MGNRAHKFLENLTIVQDIETHLNRHMEAIEKKPTLYLRFYFRMLLRVVISSFIVAFLVTLYTNLFLK